MGPANYIDYLEELATYLNLTKQEVAEIQDGFQFSTDWAKEKHRGETDAAHAYASSPQFFRQARFRMRRMVLYRRILQALLDRSGKHNEYHGKLFAPYTVQTVLDHGCGIGDIALMLAQVGYQVSVSEPVDDEGNSNLLDFVKWRFQQRYLPTPPRFGHNDPLPKESFDAVVSIEVFEHVYNVEETLQNITQAMKTGGIFFLIYEWAERPLYPELPQYDHDIVLEFMQKHYRQTAPFVWVKA